MKLQDLANQFLQMKVGNGKHTSLWYDIWSKPGCLKDVLGDRGLSDLGIADNAMVADVLGNHRRRRYKVRILNDVEDEIETLRLAANQETTLPYGSKLMGSSSIDSQLRKHENRFATVTKFAVGTGVFGSPIRRLSTPSLRGLLCETGSKLVIKCACGMLG